jgi:hypothetical protein
MEAPKKFAAYPVARDLDSLGAVVASVGAAFYQDFLYGPVEILGLLWDDYTSCELPISNLAFKAHRHSPYADVLKPSSSFQDSPAVLVGEDGALFDYYLHVGKEHSRLVRDFAVSVPILDPDASVADAARLVRRFGLVALPGDMIVTASELFMVPLAMRLDRFFV